MKGITANISLNELSSKRWEVVIVGGGMGGGAIAYSLAQKGHEVLLIEQGVANPKSASSAPAEDRDPEMLASHGQWSDQFEMVLDGSTSLLRPALGQGIGGSTLLYAASLARFERGDFSGPDADEGSANPWPISYEELEPFYLEAERLFEVSGTEDDLASYAHYELRKPPPMGERDKHFFEVMSGAGLHPYRIHNAIRYVVGCDECGGRVCNQACKGDARSRLVLPAMATGCLTVAERLKVSTVEASKTSASGVWVEKDGKRALIAGDVIVLAAGALITPALMLRSTSEDWPSGIGNTYDQVGRNLMLHASDFIAVWPRDKHPVEGPSRTIAVRDFYSHEGEKLGEFQSMGLQAGYGEILTFLHQLYDRSFLSRFQIGKHLLRIPALIAARLFKEASVFATIVEDEPLPQNRVVLSESSPSGVRIEYNIPNDLKRRVKRLRKLIKSRLSDLRIMIVNESVTLNYGHACGTCPMGLEAERSVVDVSCRVHGLSNLFIGDASVFPSSGGTNPSLTVAANALRVSERISDLLQQEEPKATIRNIVNTF